MRHRRIGGVLVTAAAGLAALAIAAGGAAAGSPWTTPTDVTCDNGQAYVFDFIAGPPWSANPPSTVPVEGGGLYSIHEITFVPHDGSASFSFKNPNGVENNQTIVTCTHVGQNFDFVFTGFFVPAG